MQEAPPDCNSVCGFVAAGGGHTGEIATLPLIPQIVDACSGHVNAFGTPVPVVGMHADPPCILCMRAHAAKPFRPQTGGPIVSVRLASR